MGTADLILCAGLALLCGWNWPPLRLLAGLLVLAAASTVFTNALDPIDRAFFFIPFDVACGVIAILIWWHKRESAALLFGLGIIGQMMIHLAVFMSPHTPAQKDFYIAALNVLFLAQCLITGGLGFARLHRDTLGRGRSGHFGRTARHGGD